MVRQDNCVRFKQRVVSWITGSHDLNFIFFLFSLSLFVVPQSTRTFHSTLNSERKTGKFPHVNAGSLLLLTFLFFMCLCCWVIAYKINQIWKKVPTSHSSTWKLLYKRSQLTWGVRWKHWFLFLFFYFIFFMEWPCCSFDSSYISQVKKHLLPVLPLKFIHTLQRQLDA